MTRLSAADQYLLDQIRQGSADGWSQLVERYQGRLVAFGRSQLGDAAEAEDLVQEVFVQFLQGVAAFRGETSLETFLFMILRRRIIDHLRRKGRAANASCAVQEAFEPDRGGWRLEQWPDDQPSVSGHMIRQEQAVRQHEALRGALQQLVSQLQQGCRFRDLQILELVFYAQLRNKDIAQLMEADEKQVALVKHRMIQRLAQQLRAQLGNGNGPLDDAMLTRLWEELRPSCPKRTTLGKAVLGTLDPAWSQYIAFHLEKLGCRFCQANMADLALPTGEVDVRRSGLYERILQSSVGFFRN